MKANFKHSDLGGLVNTEVGSRGYVFFLENGADTHYSLCSETTGKGTSFFNGYNDKDRYIRDAILIADTSIRAVPYHHQAEDRISPANFLEAAKAQEVTGNYFDYFCVITNSGEVILFKPVRKASGTKSEFIDFEVVDDEDIDTSTLEKLQAKKEYVATQLSGLHETEEAK